MLSLLTAVQFWSPELAAIGVLLALGALLAMAIDFSNIVPQLAPDVQVETDWTGGLTALPVDKKKLLLLGHKTNAGSAAIGAVKRVISRSQAILDFGAGSELACMAEVALSIAPRSPIYAVAYTAGTTPATGTVVCGAGPATAVGTLSLTVAGRNFQIGIAVGDTATNLGDAIAAAINAHPNLPVTAANVTGTVTMTARCGGSQGNTIRMSSELVGGTGLTVTTAATLTSGATDGTPTTVLAGVEPDRYHLVAINLNAATGLALLKTDREKQSGVAVKKWGIGLAGQVSTLAAAQTVQGGSGVASYRMQLVWQNECPRPCFELAAAFGALRVARQANKSLDDTEIPGFTTAVDETKWPTSAEIESALESGIVPVRQLRDGTVQVVRSVICKADSSSPVYRDHNPLEISDYIDEALIDAFTRRAKGRPLKTGSAPGTSATITPGRATGIMNEVLYKADKADYIQGVADAIKAGLHVAEINATDPNRIDCAFRFWPIAQAHFIAVKKQYVTEG